MHYIERNIKLKRIISEKFEINNIPVICFYEENKNNLPLIFLAHGFESKKEIHSDMEWNLADRGFYSVIIDAENHGERKSSGFSCSEYE
jgi:predicted alpha/beta-fold hydrolase